MDPIPETSIDPIQNLPDEIFTHSLSFLPPISIAQSSAVNQNWRHFIRSHISLLDEVDLSHMDFHWLLRRQSNEIVYWRNQANSHHEWAFYLLTNFDHLSFHASYRLVKVSLDISSIWWSTLDQERHQKDDGSQEVIETALEELLAIFQHSKASLRVIKLFIRYWKRQGSDVDGRPLDFLLPVVRELQTFPSLDLLWIEAPVYVTIKAGGENAGSKSLVLLPSFQDFLALGCEYEDPTTPMMVVEAKKFVGAQGGLTTFIHHKETEPDLPEYTLSLMEELENHTNTLQVLHFHFSFFYSDLWEKMFWDLGSRCSKLVSFNAGCYPDRNHEPPTLVLSLPSATEVSRLTSLEFNGEDPSDIDWASLRHWIGSSLEQLEMIFTITNGCEGSLSSLASIFLDSKRSLKKLHLQIYEDVMADNLEDLLCFPNLEDFALETDSKIMRLFCKIDSPKLQKLTLQGRLEGEDHFHDTASLLARYSSQLIELHFWMRSRSIDSRVLFDRPPSVSFPNLKRLRLTSAGNIDWFLKSPYPNLVSFSSASGSIPFLPKRVENPGLVDHFEWVETEASKLRRSSDSLLLPEREWERTLKKNKTSVEIKK